MKKLLIFLGLYFIAISVFSQGVKISDMPALIGNPTGAYIPGIRSGINYKIPADNFGYNKVDSLKRKAGSDSVFYYIHGARVFAFRDSIGGSVTQSQLDDTAAAIRSDFPTASTSDSATYFNVISGINTPPASPAAGNQYRVNTSPSGAWVGHANDIATWNGASWDFTDASVNDYCYQSVDKKTYQFKSDNTWHLSPGVAIINNKQNISTGMDIGLTNNKDLTFYTNNIARGGFKNSGGFFINTGSDAAGDIYYRNSSGYFNRLGIGSEGQVLNVISGLPAWGAWLNLDSLIINAPNLGATTHQRITLRNPTAATNILDQYPPSIAFEGHVWNGGVDETDVGSIVYRPISGNHGAFDFITGAYTTTIESGTLTVPALVTTIGANLGGNVYLGTILPNLFPITINNGGGGLTGSSTGFNQGTLAIGKGGSIPGYDFNSKSGGHSYNLSLNEAYQQTGTAGGTELYISPYYLSQGSGDYYLIDAGVNTGGSLSGTHTSKFTVDEDGNGYFSGNLNVSGTVSGGGTGGIHAFHSGYGLTSIDDSTAKVDTTLMMTRAYSASNPNNYFIRSGDSASYVWLPNQTVATTPPANGVKMFDSSGRWSYRTSLGKTVSISTSNLATNQAVIDTVPAYSGTYVMKYQSDSLFDKVILGSQNTGGNLNIFSTKHATKGKVYVDTSFTFDGATNRFGIGTLTPTHQLTLAKATSNGGLVLYNTTDPTNFERGFMNFTSDVFTINTVSNGTGVTRDIKIGGNAFLYVATTAAVNGAWVTAGRSTSSTVTDFAVSTTKTSTSGSTNSIAIIPTINQSSTASYRGLWISPFEQTTGSGTKYLIDAGTNSAGSGGGTHTPKFIVDNSGNTTIVGTATIATTASGTAGTDSILVQNNGLVKKIGPVLPIAAGGTNNGSLVVTAGTIYYGDGTKLVGLAPGTSSQVLHSGTTPSWKDTTDPRPVRVVLSGDYTNTSTTMTDVTSFTIATVSGKKYTLSGTLGTSCNTANGVKIGVKITNATLHSGALFGNVSGVTSLRLVSVTAIDGTTLGTFNTVAASEINKLEVDFTATNTGAITVTIGAVTGGDNAVVKSGSVLRLTEVQ